MTNQSSDDFLREIDELLGSGEGAGEEEEDSLPVPEKPKTGVEALKAALAAHEDVEVIRGLCEGGRVPDELRGEVWKECLGVSRRPDALGTWSGPLDCEHQATIHAQCQEQAAKLGLEGEAKEQAVLDMEVVLTFYCKSRNIRYFEDCGWPELLLPFVALGFSRADLFNCFYAIMVKYIPRDCRAGGRPFHLFRLLLLYHDPELCSSLDTQRLSPEAYLQPWLRSLFVSQCDLVVVWAMWDLYLLERDPFLSFFLALVMVVNAKEQVMGSGGMGGEELCATLSSLPCQLSGEDMEDFFSLAQYYATRTPQSFRKDYHGLLFGSGRSIVTIATNVSHALCLPVSLQEILELNYSSSSESSGGMHYFVVDCRPVEHFCCGHLPKAFHLDANLLLHSPTDFSVAADRLCERVSRAGVEGGEHLCFLGSGREQEDQYVNMVVAKFLHKSVPYVSLARGGFLELVTLLGGRVERVVEDYDAEKCQAFYSDGAPAHKNACHTQSDSDSETSSLYRQKLKAKGAQLYAQMASGFRERSQRFRTRVGGFWTSQQRPQERHVSQSDRPSKRYRNIHADVFVIADEDEEENEHPSASSSEDEGGQGMVNISLFSTNPEILYSFPCTEIKEGVELFPSHLLLTAESLVVLRELSDRAGWARIKHRHRLDYILKITAKKKHPDIITFKFGSGVGEEAVVSHQLRFRIPNTSRCTSAIKSTIARLQGQPR